MKIQLSPAPPTTPTEGAPNTSDTKASAAPSAEMVRAGQLHKLLNTWAKVESSQILDPAKTQLALAALQSANPAIAGSKQTPVPPSTATLGKPVIPELQLVQLQLSTAKGLLNILSPKLYDKGTMLLISKNTQGQWQLQSSAPSLSLTALSHQFRDLNMAAGPLKLFNTPQPNSPLTSSSTNSLPVQSNLTAALSPALHSDEKVDAGGVKKALSSSGQFFESSLRGGPAAPLNAQKPQITMNIGAGLKKVESQLQKWIEALPVSLKKAAQTKLAPPAHSQTQSHATKADLVKFSETAKNINIDTQPAPANRSTADNKAWLIQLQQQLFKDWKQQVTSPAAKAPSTAALPTSQASNIKEAIAVAGVITDGRLTESITHLATHLKGDGVKSASLLEWLLAPKMPSEAKSLPVFPQNLSAQQQVHKLLQSMVLLTTDNQEAPDEPANQLLRQLLNVSQSLSRIQGEQINNRLVMQNQPDNVQLNFSLPYLHQQTMHWCELELSQDSPSESDNRSTLGWHLVLRFAQDTQEAFAIESYLNSNQLQLTLWAQQQQALAKLSRHSALLREKLTRAGFEVENIQSKRGNPSKNSRQVHQSMIDVHT